MNTVNDLKARLKWLRKNAKGGFDIGVESHPINRGLTFVTFKVFDPIEEKQFLAWKAKYEKRQA